MERILNNLFTKDNYGRRGVRLQEVESQIDKLQPSLGLHAELLAWAQNCHTIFMEAWVNSDVEKGEMNGAFTTLQMKEAEMAEAYSDIKGVVLSRYAGDAEHLRDFQFGESVSKARVVRVERVRRMVTVSERHRAEGIVHALPVAMTDRLTAVADAVDDAFEQADIQRSQSEHCTAELRALYRADTIRLMQLHTWARSVWGRRDLRFELIGMVPAKDRRAGYPAMPENLAFDADTANFSWDATERTTSYQLVYAPQKKDWQEAYEGGEPSAQFDPGTGKWNFKVRARNKHGFGKWSEILTIVIA